jgi:hypothetical protein
VERLVREREAKLLVSADFELPRFDGIGGGIRVAADETVDQRAVYFDTPDLRLTHSGASLRYRSDDGWTVKLPAPGDGSNLVRTEHTFAGSPSEPPAAALDLLRAWIRTAPIDEVAEVRTSRHRLVLNDAAGAKIAEIDDDRVTTASHRGARKEFREVEVELSEHAPKRLDRRLARHVKASGTDEEVVTFQSRPRARHSHDLLPFCGSGRVRHRSHPDATTVDRRTGSNRCFRTAAASQRPSDQDRRRSRRECTRLGSRRVASDPTCARSVRCSTSCGAKPYERIWRDSAPRSGRSAMPTC